MNLEAQEKVWGGAGGLGEDLHDLFVESGREEGEASAGGRLQSGEWGLRIGFGGEKRERGCEDYQLVSLASEVCRFMGSSIPTYESFSRKMENYMTDWI